MIDEINAEWEKSDRLTVAKLNAVKQFNKQDHKSKLMTEKYLLLPLNPQQLTPVQTAIQRMSEKHPDFKIEPVNTIQAPEIEYMSCISKTACFLLNCTSLFPPVWMERGAKTTRSCLVHRSSIIELHQQHRTGPNLVRKASANQRPSRH